MSKKENVSLWIGKFETIEEFESYTLASSTDEGDYLPSQFEDNFNIIDLNHDFIESNYSNEYIIEQLKGISYEDEIIQQFIFLLEDEDLKQYNAFILLYEYEYNGETKEVIKGNNIFKFIGTASYDI